MNLDHGQELSSIDFSAMIGGPLNAVVEAQAKSAMATINFIKTIGFEPDVVTPEVPATGTNPATPATTKPGKAKTVVFAYDKTNPNYDQDVEGSEEILTYELHIPTLAIAPIPYLRVEDVTIQFNAKITSAVYERNTTAEAYGGSISAKAGWGWGSARLSAYYSKRKSTVSGSQVNRTYSLDVKVHAVQDEIPAGLDRVLGILEDSISEVQQPTEETE